MTAARNHAVAEPWPDAVSASELLDDIRARIAQHVVLTSAQVDALALFVLHTYAIDAAEFTPYIFVTSPARESGKSTLLIVLRSVVNAPVLSSSMSSASLYRYIDRATKDGRPPTVLIDEMDAMLERDSEGMRGVLDAGFQRGFEHIRCNGDRNEPEGYISFSPKILAGIGRLWDTVESRSVPIQLTRATLEQRKKLVRVRGDLINKQTEDIRRKCIRWAVDNVDALRHLEHPEPHEALSARQADIWRPLIAIASRIGFGWTERAQRAASSLHAKTDGAEHGDDGVQLLSDARMILADREFISTAELLGGLNEIEAARWSEYKHGKQLSARQLAKLLKAFGIAPGPARTDKSFSGNSKRGYWSSAFQAAFDAYLEPHHPEKA